jgi:hypothetical protein
LGITLYFSSHELKAITPRLRALYAAANMFVIEQAFTEDDDLSLNILTELSKSSLLVEDVLKITTGMG